MSELHATLRCPCGDRHMARAFAYDAPPAGETRFDLGGTAYARRYDRCTLCGHWFSRHALDLVRLYDQSYVDATYGGVEGMRARFARIAALPPDKSDNAGRVARILAFAAALSARPTTQRRLLDVGAGIGVFPAAMKAAGWQVVALEPDPRSAAHLRDFVAVEAHSTAVEALDAGAVGQFDAITFNKVLEHVEDPVAMLAAAVPLLAQGGFVYVELPDAEGAAVEGPGREEFFIEHHHVFSACSMGMLAARAGLEMVTLERLREPSGKFSLRGFFGRTA